MHFTAENLGKVAKSLELTGTAQKVYLLTILLYYEYFVITEVNNSNIVKHKILFVRSTVLS